MSVAIERHRTAMARTALSRPLTLAMNDGLIPREAAVFDYGCGRGGDVLRLQALGHTCLGWDPAFFPHNPLVASPVVNLGFVVNVIERATERADVLKRAWDLAHDVLIVAARLEWEAAGLRTATSFADGLITGRSTFQHLFRQEELSEWIEAVLGVRPIAAAPGIFYVFRSEERAQSFLASRFRRISIPAPRPAISQVLFETHRPLLEGLMAFFGEHGRVPVPEEVPDSPAIQTHFGTIVRAFGVVRSVTGQDHWNRVQDDRRQDLLVYLALARFGRRPRLSHLAPGLQLDIKALFGTYAKACTASDELLFSVGRENVIDNACRMANLGKLTPDALYVHSSALSTLSPVLRVYEGCARTLTGSVEAATLVKLTRGKPRVSYLIYPSFDVDPHPALVGAVTASLQSLRVDYRNYSQSSNPPILHRKETFVGSDYGLREKFKRLTVQEERWGLYDDVTRIGTRNGWESTLLLHGVALRGHRVVRERSPVNSHS